MRTFKQLYYSINETRKDQTNYQKNTCTLQHSTETPMSAKTQRNIKNNLDLVGEYVTHIHTYTDTPIYLTQLYRNTCVRKVN